MVIRMFVDVADAESGAVNLSVNSALVTATQSWANTAFLAKSQNLSDLPDKAAARANLGVVSAVLQALYPVGEYYATARAGNPSVLLGFGTWVRWSEGRALFGVNPSTPTMSAAGMTGGSATLTLSIANLPAHDHSVGQIAATVAAASDHSHTVEPPATTTSQAGTHHHAYDDIYHAEAASYVGTLGVATTTIPGGRGSGSTDNDNVGWLRSATTAATGLHAHTVDISPFPSEPAGAHSHSVTVPAHDTTSVGSGTPAPITPPFTTVNIWRRTA